MKPKLDINAIDFDCHGRMLFIDDPLLLELVSGAWGPDTGDFELADNYGCNAICGGNIA